MYMYKSDPVPLLLKALLWFLVALGIKSPILIIQNIPHAWSLPVPPHHGPHRDLLHFVPVIQGPRSYFSIKSN